MASSSIPLSVKATLKIEKYPEGTTDEQIKNGEIKPTEVIVSKDDFDATEEQLAELLINEEEAK
jgi:hypothetical protein